jgi:hypothetical protein
MSRHIPQISMFVTIWIYDGPHSMRSVAILVQSAAVLSVLVSWLLHITVKIGMDMRKGFPGSIATSRRPVPPTRWERENQLNRDSDYRIVYQLYSLFCELQAIRTGRHESRIPTESDSYTRG